MVDRKHRQGLLVDQVERAIGKGLGDRHVIDPQRPLLGVVGGWEDGQEEVLRLRGDEVPAFGDGLLERPPLGTDRERHGTGRRRVAVRAEGLVSRPLKLRPAVAIAAGPEADCIDASRLRSDGLLGRGNDVTPRRCRMVEPEAALSGVRVGRVARVVRRDLERLGAPHHPPWRRADRRLGFEIGLEHGAARGEQTEQTETAQTHDHPPKLGGATPGGGRAALPAGSQGRSARAAMRRARGPPVGIPPAAGRSFLRGQRRVCAEDSAWVTSPRQPRDAVPSCPGGDSEPRP